MKNALPLVLCLLLASGCDKGPEQLREAEAGYRELVEKGVHPADPRWDRVIAAFEAIPPDSQARPEAEARLSTLRTLRTGALPPRPLATPGSTGPGTSEADAKRAACEALARKLGQTQEQPAREPLRQALAQCHADLVRLEARSHAPGEHGHEHGGPGAPDAGDPR